MTLVRAQLWPATLHYLRYGFSFQLLDLAESLLLECHVALKDFHEALYFKYPFPLSKVWVGLFLKFMLWMIPAFTAKGYIFMSYRLL